MTEEQFEDHDVTPESQESESQESEEPETDELPEGDAVAELEAASSDDGGAAVTTGVQVVDDVLGTLVGLEDESVEAHLPIFEAAHEQLRSALDGSDAGQSD